MEWWALQASPVLQSPEAILSGRSSVPGLSLHLHTHHLIASSQPAFMSSIGGEKKCHSLPNITEL